MIKQYSSSGKTSRISFLVIPLGSFAIFIILMFPLILLAYLLTFTYKVPSVVYFTICFIFSLLFSYFNKFIIHFGHCRNYIIAFVLSLIGFTFAFICYITIFILLIASNYQYLDLHIIITDISLIFANFNQFIELISSLTLGRVLLVKLLFTYLVFVVSIFFYIKYISIYPYSEEFRRWFKFKSFDKAINTSKDQKYISNLINSNKFSTLFSNKVNDKGPNHIDFDVYYIPNYKEFVVSIYYNSIKAGKKVSSIISKNLFYSGKNADLIAKFLNFV